MMKRIRGGAVALAALLNTPVWAYDVRIDVTGNITSSTCTVDAGSRNLVVDMGTIDNRRLNTVGEVTGIRQFDLVLVGCGPAAKAVSVMFKGDADRDDPNLLKLKENGAGGLGIEILDNKRTPVPINQSTEDYALIANADNQLTFHAQYKITRLPVTPGVADAVMDFTLEYQ